MFNDSRCWLAAHTLFGTLCISTSVLAVELTPDLQLHGYLTAGLAKLDKNQDTTYPNPLGSGMPVIKSKLTSNYDSVAGLQLNYKVNDQIDMATQFYVAATGEPENNYEVKTNWAYVDYKLNDEWTVRAGRFGFASYLYSENLKVGAAYPWARLPSEIYSQLGGLYSENGVAVLYRHAMGDWMLRVQPSFGEQKLKEFKVNRIKQLSASLSNENLTLHIGSGLASADIADATKTALTVGLDGALAGFGYSPADIDQYNAALYSSVKFNNVRAAFSDVGFLYDDGRWFAAGELSALRFKGFVSDFNAGYVSAGHYVGKWLPYVLYGQYKSTNVYQANEIPAPGDEIYATPARWEQRTVAVGARYQFKPNVSLKLQVDQVSGFNREYLSGFFLPPPTTTTPSTLKTAYIYSASLNAAF